ncbi:MAG: ABC transporter ATP-binding protein [Clostridiales bacterium]|nr:ABC transporter ATP-binding protein [Clostridiales bacterium]
MIFGKYINKYYLRYALLIILGLAALVAVDYAQLMIPEMYRIVIDGVDKGSVVINGVSQVFDLDLLWKEVCIPMFIIIVAMVFGRFLWRICLFGSGIRVERDLRKKMFAHCEELSCDFYSREKIGNLMSLFTNDLETVQDCFGSGILMTFDALFQGGLALYKMFSMNWMMTLFSLIPMAFMVAISLLVGKYMTMKWNVRQQAFSDLSDFSQESFSGIAVIKAFVKEFKELLAFRWLNKKNEDANVAYTRISTLLNIFVTLFVESVICIVLGYGSYLVYNGVFTAGQLMEFIGYFNSVIWPVMAITELIEMSSRGKASLKRVSDLLDTKVTVTDRDYAVAVDHVDGAIEFKNLTFRYPGADYNSLENVSFVINRGENVGIVGKTGSGKTTVADLILRCYNVDEETVFIDGADVNGITIKSLRDNCAYVPQDNFLFSDTIANNIAFASDTGSIDEVINAAKLSDIDDNISKFSHGYETVLGERGVTVSGGQKQRISIARALMKNASILILDDSVSAVDTDTEKTILRNLRDTREGKTTILIAHRISTVQSLDKIILLDNGKVVDVGSHDELMARCADYQNMVALQALEDEEGK